MWETCNKRVRELYCRNITFWVHVISHLLSYYRGPTEDGVITHYRNLPLIRYLTIYAWKGYVIFAKKVQKELSKKTCEFPAQQQKFCTLSSSSAKRPLKREANSSKASCSRYGNRRREGFLQDTYAYWKDLYWFFQSIEIPHFFVKSMSDDGSNDGGDMNVDQVT